MWMFVILTLYNMNEQLPFILAFVYVTERGQVAN
jgi:hypothetical protein